MSRSAVLAVILLLGAPCLQAEQRPAPREIIVIPKTYVSPGASGSIGGYQQYDRQRLLNGRRLPDVNYRQRIDSSESQVQQWGGIRQSIEYPAGLRIQRLPDSGSGQRHRNH